MGRSCHLSGISQGWLLFLWNPGDGATASAEEIACSRAWLAGVVKVDRDEGSLSLWVVMISAQAPV